MRTFIWILSGIIIAGVIFYAGYMTADTTYLNKSDEKWEKTFDYIKEYCRYAPNFVELPTGEFVILRLYPVDYAFRVNESWPGKNLVVDTLRANYIITNHEE